MGKNDTMLLALAAVVGVFVFTRKPADAQASGDGMLPGIGITMPEIKMPEIKMPEIKMPEIKMPGFPDINLLGGGNGSNDSNAGPITQQTNDDPVIDLNPFPDKVTVIPPSPPVLDIPWHKQPFWDILGTMFDPRTNIWRPNTVVTLNQRRWQQGEGAWEYQGIKRTWGIIEEATGLTEINNPQELAQAQAAISKKPTQHTAETIEAAYDLGVFPWTR